MRQHANDRPEEERARRQARLWDGLRKIGAARREADAEKERQLDTARKKGEAAGLARQA
jgi:hypothetical protein